MVSVKSALTCGTLLGKRNFSVYIEDFIMGRMRRFWSLPFRFYNLFSYILVLNLKQGNEPWENSQSWTCFCNNLKTAKTNLEPPKRCDQKVNVQKFEYLVQRAPRKSPQYSRYCHWWALSWILSFTDLKQTKSTRTQSRPKFNLTLPRRIRSKWIIHQVKVAVFIEFVKRMC